MATDRTRLTYTPARQYREVVSQQGRVTLEADVNEASRIASEATRLDALDFAGPVGTPDDGYAVTPTGGGLDLAIGPGTIYVGGLRLRLEAMVRHSAQPDWRDIATDPLWQQQAPISSNAALALLAIEHEITAEEDPALREVALGGPDSAARTRILQRFLLMPGQAATCAAAGAQIRAFWVAHGRTYVEAAAALQPHARLRVTALSTPPAASPCDPPAQTGYLGADNQLIRVQITAFDAATGQGRLVWGWNNASTLYRCTPHDATTLELARRPVSPEFAPATNQAVQLLMPAADLGEGAIAAALTGHVATLTAPYQPDTRLVTLPTAMPVPYQTPPAGMPLFLRLWQEDKPFTLGAQVELTGTGLAVTITAVTGNVVTVGDYWSIGVRPHTPNQVYPERLLAAPQPPDGPRTWLCPLAMVRRSGGMWQRPADCRQPFDTLVELTRRTDACHCTLVFGPEDDWSNLAQRMPADRQLLICLKAGVYHFGAPIVFDGATENEHGRLRVVGAGAATRIVGAGKVALFFRNWQKVSIADLAVETQRAVVGGPTDFLGLGGSLTFSECTESEVSNVDVRCASAAGRRQAACIRFDQQLKLGEVASASVRVRGCRLRLGDNGIGILVVNAARVMIADNEIDQAETNATPTPLGKLDRARLVRSLTSGATYGSAAIARLPLPGRARAEVRSGNFRTAFDTPAALAPLWQAFVDANPTLQAASGHKPLLDAVRGGINRILAAGGSAGMVVPAKLLDILAGLLARKRSAEQGIVIGGTSAIDVHINGNVVYGVRQGIHLGLSHQDSTRTSRDVIGRVHVTGNTVTVRLDALATRERHGIFLGSCDSAIIEGNMLTLERIEGADRPIDGVRVLGQLGRFIQVRNNHVQRFTTGIRIEPLNAPHGLPLWLVADNLAANAQSAVVASSAVRNTGNLA